MFSGLDAANSILRRTGVPPGWKEFHLGELVRIVGGGTPEKAQRSSGGEGAIPWITPTDLSANSSKYISGGAERLTERALRESTAALVPKGAIIFSARGTVGRAAIATRSLACNQSCETLIPISNEATSEFIYYLLDFGLYAFQRMAGGTTFEAITRREISRVRFAIPPLTEQAAIASILDCVDRTIELTRELLQQAISFNGALLHALLKTGINENGQARGRNQEAGNFNKTELGPLPAGWKVARLRDVAELERGRFSPRLRNNPRYYGGPHHFVQAGLVVKAGGRTLHCADQSLSELGKSISREFPAGTILFTIAATLGETAILGRPMCVADSMVGIETSPQNSPRYIEMCLRRLKPKFSAASERSAQRYLNIQTLKALRIPLPPLAEQQRIAALYEAAERKVQIYEKQFRALTCFKQTLMRDLLTGKVRVRHPEC